MSNLDAEPIHIEFLAVAVEKLKDGHGIVSELGPESHPSLQVSLQQSSSSLIPTTREVLKGKEHWGCVDSIVYHTDVSIFTHVPEVVKKDKPKNDKFAVHTNEPPGQDASLPKLLWRSCISHIQQIRSGHTSYEITTLGIASAQDLNTMEHRLVSYGQRIL